VSTYQILFGLTLLVRQGVYNRWTVYMLHGPKCHTGNVGTVVKYNIAPEGSTQCQNFTCGTSNALLLLRYYHNIDLLH
jgi:hypothetical protein